MGYDCFTRIKLDREQYSLSQQFPLFCFYRFENDLHVGACPFLLLFRILLFPSCEEAELPHWKLHENKRMESWKVLRENNFWRIKCYKEEKVLQEKKLQFSSHSSRGYQNHLDSSILNCIRMNESSRYYANYRQAIPGEFFSVNLQNHRQILF